MSDAISDRRQRPVDVWRMRKKFMDLLTTPGSLGFPPSNYTEQDVTFPCSYRSTCFTPHHPQHSLLLLRNKTYDPPGRIYGE